MEVVSSLLLRHNQCWFFDPIFKYDDECIMYNNLRHSGQWLGVDKIGIQFPKSDLHPKKGMIVVWCNETGIIQYSFLEKGKTITAASFSRKIDQCPQKNGKKVPKCAKF